MTGAATTIDNMKTKIQDKFGIPTSDQKLVFHTVVLTEGLVADLLRFSQEEAVMHVRDTRCMQVFIYTLSGRTSVIEVVPSLPVSTVKVRIRTIAGLEHLRIADQRLTFAGRELLDGSLLSDYNIQEESVLQLSLRMFGGADDDADDYDNEDDEQVSNGSHEDVYDGDTDDTASADSLIGYDASTDSENDGGLFNHRAIRVQGLFESYVAPSPVDIESDSQATTIRHVPFDLFRGSSAGGDSPPAEPNTSEPFDLFRGLSAGGSFGTGVGEAAIPQGDPDPSAPFDLFRGLSAGGSFGTGGEGEPTGKRARHSEGFQLIVKAVSGKTYILWVTPADTVLMQKVTLFHLMGFLFTDPKDLKLLYNGKQLEDDKTLADYNIHEESFVSILLGIRGGAGGGGMDDSDGDAMHDLSQEQQQQVTKCPLGGLPSTPQVAPKPAFSFHFFES